MSVPQGAVIPSITKFQRLRDVAPPFADGQHIVAEDDGAGGIRFAGAFISIANISEPMTFDLPPTGLLGGDTELIFADQPAADPTKALIQLNGPLPPTASPNGTYIGGMIPDTFTGSVIDIWQAGTPDARRFQVTTDGIAFQGRTFTYVNILNAHPSEAGALGVYEPVGGGGISIAHHPAGMDGTLIRKIPLSGELRANSLLTNGLYLTSSATTGPIVFVTGGSTLAQRRWQIDATGNLLPYGSTYNIGEPTNRSATIYGGTGDFEAVGYRIRIGGDVGLGPYVASTGVNEGGFAFGSPNTVFPVVGMVLNNGGLSLGRDDFRFNTLYARAVNLTGPYGGVGQVHIAPADGSEATVFLKSTSNAGSQLLMQSSFGLWYQYTDAASNGNLNWYAAGGLAMSLSQLGRWRNYAERSSDGYTEIGSAGSSFHSGYIHTRSEFEGYGQYYDASRAANIAAATGFYYAAHQFGTGFLCTTGNILQVNNQTEYRFNIAARGPTTIRNDIPNTGHILELQHGGGEVAAQFPNTGGLVLNSTAFGLLPPRMLTTERNVIPAPPDGLILYNTTDGRFQGRQAGAWVDLGEGAAAPHDITGPTHTISVPLSSVGWVLTAIDETTIGWAPAPGSPGGSGLPLAGGTMLGPITFDWGTAGLPNGGTELIFADAPAMDATKSLIQLNGPLTTGSPNGTYLGGVLDPAFAGSLFDVWGGATPARRFQVTWDGRIGIGGPDMFTGVGSFASVFAKGRVGIATLDPQNAYIIIENNHNAAQAAFAIQQAAPNTQSYTGLYLLPSGQTGPNIFNIPLSAQLRSGPLNTGGLQLHSYAPTGEGIVFATGGQALSNRRWKVDPAGHLTPFGSTYDIGNITDRVRALYGMDASFSGALTIGSLTGVLKATTGLVSGGATTSDLPEGTNLYFTPARAVAAVHPQVHALIGSDHTIASGLTPGHVLTILPDDAFGWLPPGGGGGFDAPVTSFVMVDDASPPEHWRVTINSDGVLVTTPLYVNPPKAPINLTTIAASPTAINVAWDYVPGADTYDVEHSTDGSSWSPLATVAVPGYLHTGLTPGTVHHYRVTATNEHGTSPYAKNSTAPYLTTSFAYTSPAQVVGLGVSVVSGSAMNLAWAALDEDPATYHIEVSLDNVYWGEIGTSTTPVFSHTGFTVAPGTTIYYRVKARSPVGTPINGGANYTDGAYSAVASGTTPP